MAENHLTSLSLDNPTLDRIYNVLEKQRKQNRTLSRADILREVISEGLVVVEKKNGVRR
jgi:hypothetical protein